MVLKVRVSGSPLFGDEISRSETSFARETVTRLRHSLSGLTHPDLDSQLTNLAAETTRPSFEKRLFLLGAQEEKAGRIAVAQAVYSQLTDTAENSKIRQAARERLDVFSNRGAWLPRGEFILRQAVRGGTEPLGLLSFGIAGAAFRLGRVGMLARLTAGPAKSFFNYGIGARAVAGLFGLAMEGSALTATGHLGGKILGHDVSSWGRDLASSLLVMGSMRLVGWAGTSLYHWSGAPSGLTQSLVNLGGALGGIGLGIKAEHWTGLRENSPDAHLLQESLQLLLQNQFAGVLSRPLFGSRFAAWEQNMDRRAEQLARKAPRQALASWLNVFNSSYAPADGPPIGPTPLETTGRQENRDLSLQNVKMEGQPAEAPSAIPEFTYPPEVEAAWRHVEERWKDRRYFTGTREDLARRRPNPDSVDQIWLHQAEDYGQRIPGARVEILDADVLFTTHRGTLQQSLNALGSRNQVDGLARRLVRIHIPHSFTTAESPTLDYLSFFPPVSEAEHVLGDRVRFLKHDKDFARIDIVSLSLLESLYQTLLGKKNVQFHPVPGEIPRDLTMSIRARRASPVGMSRNQIYLGDVKEEVHPFSFASHDAILHAALDGNIYDPYPAIGGWLYRQVQLKVPFGTWRETHLDQLSDSSLGQRRSGIKKLSQHLLKIPLESALFSVQLSDDLQLNQHRQLTLRNYVEAYRNLVLEEFRHQSQLAGKEKYFFAPLQDASRDLKIIQEISDQTQALGIEVPPPVYHGKMLSVLKRIEKKFSDPNYLQGTREELLAKRVDPRDADALWFHQAKHYASLFPGAEFRITGVEELLKEAHGKTAKPDRRLLQNAISQLNKRQQWANSLARQVLVIEIPIDIYEGDGPLHKHPHLKFLASVPALHETEQSIGDRIHFMDSNSEGSRAIYRIPSLSLTEKLLQEVHGAEQIQLHPVPGVISQEQTMHLRGQRVESIGLSFAPLYFEEFGGPIHQWILPQHDLFEHASQNAAQPKGVPELAAALYEEIKNSFPDSPMKEKVLNSFSDLSISQSIWEPLAAGVARTLMDPVVQNKRQMGGNNNTMEVRDLLQESHEYVETVRRLLERLPSLPAFADHVPDIIQTFETVVKDLPPKSVILQLEREMGPGGKPLIYTPEMEEVWQYLEKSFKRKGYLDGGREELLRKRPDPDAIDQLWLFQGKQYFEQLPEGHLRIRDAEEVFFQENEEHLEKTDTKLFKRGLRMLGERGRPNSLARQVMEFEIPNDVLNQKSTEALFGDNLGLNFLIALSEVQFFLGDRIPLMLIGEKSTQFRLSTLSLWENLLRARRGSEHVQFHYVLGAPPRDKVMALRAQGTPAIGFARDNIFLGDILKLGPGFIFTLHDAYFHAARDSTRELGVSELAHRLYHHFQDYLDSSHTKTHTLDRLADLDDMPEIVPDMISLLHETFQISMKGNGSELPSRKINEFNELSSGFPAMLRQRWFRGRPLDPREKTSLRELLELRRAILSILKKQVTEE